MDSLYFKTVQDKWVLANLVRPHSANPGTGVPKCLASNSATPPVRSLASIDYHKPIERGRAPSRPLAIDEEWKRYHADHQRPDRKAEADQVAPDDQLPASLGGENGLGKLSEAQKGLAWIRTNQSKADGRWQAWSVNVKRDPESQVGKFMSDAATAFSVMALNASQ